MYPSLKPESIHVHLMHDLLFIELNDFANETAYIVKNEEDKTVRKGRFTGHAVQLSLFHLPSGRYRLKLNHVNEVVDYYFEKQENNYTVSGIYTNTGGKEFYHELF